MRLSILSEIFIANPLLYRAAPAANRARIIGISRYTGGLGNSRHIALVA
jgi:hypothetical protein